MNAKRALEENGAAIGLLHVNGCGSPEALADGGDLLNAFVTPGYHQDGDLFFDDLISWIHPATPCRG